MKLSQGINEDLVKAVVNGHKDSLLNKKAAGLLVDGGFAWTKSNYIDDTIAKNVEVSYVKRTVGGWPYLEFTIEQGDEKYLLVVKSPDTAKKAVDSKNAENYNKEYLLINGFGDFSKDSSYTEQSTLFSDNVDDIANIQSESLLSEYSRCYFLVCTTDSMSEMVTKVSLVLPSIDGYLFEVENLSQYIDYSYDKNIESDSPINVVDETDEDTSELHIYKAIEEEKKQTE